ncbi:hypothetical protein BDN72DRAFT_846641, partial [Pluteus cervinus]
MHLSARPPDQDASRADPFLPREIELEVFVLAFRYCEDPKSQAPLLRIAKRVSEWLLPLFYRVAIIHHDGINTRYPPLASLEKYGHHTRHLFILNNSRKGPPMSTSALLSSCPNMTNIAFWYRTPLIPGILDLPIKRLALNGFYLKSFEGGHGSNPKDTRLVQWCSNITHLSLGAGELYSETDIRYLTLFPALKYLILLDHSHLDRVDVILRHCPSLRVVIGLGMVGFVRDYTTAQVCRDLDEDDGRDIRVVKMDGLFMTDWIRGARGSDLEDIWKLAEREVEDEGRRNVFAD